MNFWELQIRDYVQTSKKIEKMQIEGEHRRIATIYL